MILKIGEKPELVTHHINNLKTSFQLTQVTQIPQFLQLSSTKTDLNSLVHYPPDMLFSHSYSNRPITGRNIYILQMLENIGTAQRMSSVVSLHPTSWSSRPSRCFRDTDKHQPVISSYTQKVTASSLPIKIKEAISSRAVSFSKESHF